MTQYTRPSPSVPVWAESGDKVQPTNPEVQTGWPASPTPPSRQRFNWLLGFLAQGTRYLLQRGIPEWVTGEDYPANARVQYLGTTFKALISSPTSAPGVVPGEWEQWAISAGDVITPPQFDADNSIATTEFVQRFGNSARNLIAAAAPLNLTAATHAGATVVITGSGAVNLPAASSCPAGTVIHLVNNNVSNAWTLNRAGADTINIAGTTPTSLSFVGGDTATLVSNGSNAWFVVDGSMALGSWGKFIAVQGGSGYQRLPSGFIIQWGPFALSVSSYTFPIAFPTACRSMSQMQSGASSAGTGRLSFVAGGSGFTNSGFTIDSSPISSNLPAYWIAIGH